MSGKIFAIGCLHIGHENISKMRGWDSSEKMFKVLKENCSRKSRFAEKSSLGRAFEICKLCPWNG